MNGNIIIRNPKASVQFNELINGDVFRYAEGFLDGKLEPSNGDIAGDIFVMVNKEIFGPGQCICLNTGELTWFHPNGQQRYQICHTGDLTFGA